ncbi:MAG: 6,7-dimethyl-8-ribityllumazine synthase [Bacteroidota bacterium]|nr:6,7-dimethyl-8-ribityllumazine synthase [Bacteroidota bacterium]
MNIIKGSLEEKDINIAIVVSRFNEIITDKLLKGAWDFLLSKEISEDKIKIYQVPGAFEIPLAAEKLASLKKYDAIIGLGAVIKGETPHFDFVSAAAANGILNTSLKYGVPVIFGVLTTNTIKQALERSGGESNKGVDCAQTALEMISLLKKID